MKRGSMFGLSIVESPYVGCDKARFPPKADGHTVVRDRIPGAAPARHSWIRFLAHTGATQRAGDRKGWRMISPGDRPVESETAGPNRDNLA
jgi:hypothetical protein